MNIMEQLSREINLRDNQVQAVIKLLKEGATVPFIARYRKEATGGMDDNQLRLFVERFQYLTELEERRSTILKSIQDQGKLTEELAQKIKNAENKTLLEDLYLPYRPKRRTKGQIAIEAGLEPLALTLWQNPLEDPTQLAGKFLNIEKEIKDEHAALDGAKYILMEKFAEDADLLTKLRNFLWEKGLVFSKMVKEKQEVSDFNKFADYFEFSESIKKIPSHRALALFRGSKLGCLSLSLDFKEKSEADYCCRMIANHFQIENKNRPADDWLQQVVEWAWKIKLHLKLELDLFNQLREQAEIEAIAVFKGNLKNLLMMSPAGNRVTLGLDPGFRTGVKVVVVDGTGKLLEYITIYPHEPKKEWDKSLTILKSLCLSHQVELISIGNGTASRETVKLIGELLQTNSGLNLQKVVVSEAGASVYSASELASLEFPDLDVSYRGSVSIARRLQDPLAELVKIDPKAIGVGQYQHDVNQIKLSKSLEAVVEDCVNSVGADLNTASAPLLSSISGLNEGVAKSIVNYREQHGRFKNRLEILKVPRLGQKTYEQAIGFLRIIGGDNPLDASAVHPESYPVVDTILVHTGKSLAEIMGNYEILNSLSPQQFCNQHYGLPTVLDIIMELKKPGRDPRPQFEVAIFQEGIDSIQNLTPGMKLEGVVSNVANFGAFIDIGVHQDGLVHISEVADNFVSNIHEILKVGQIVQVTVLSVDIERKRISLSLKSDLLKIKQNETKIDRKETKPTKNKDKSPLKKASTNNLLAEKLKEALKRK